MFKDFLKNIKNSFWIALLVFVFVGGYFYFINSVKADRYQLFNPKKTITWAQSQNSLYRTHTHRSVDNVLLSEDSWTDYDFSAKIANPGDCGFLYDYLDANNYHFVYFQKKPGVIISGELKDAKVQVVKSLAFNLPSLLDVTVQKQVGVVNFTVNGKKIFESKTEAAAGKIGLMVNSADMPPTIFYQIAMRGTLFNGKFLTAQVSVKSESGVTHAFKSFIPFYLGFGLIVILLPFFLTRWCFFQCGIVNKNKAFLKSCVPYLFHVFLAVCFFWPFFARGEVAVFSYDNLGEIYPLFYYAQQNFLNILHGHAPWLWNPLIQNGFPFYSNHWDMIYYPLNWPVFFSAPENLLTALTWKSFFEVVGIGIFAYGFFVLELQNKRWALFSSVAYQICSLLIFTMGIFPASSTYFAMTFYLYVLWSAKARRALTNFLLLAFAVVLILTSANVAFIFYACLALAVISIYRFLSVGVDGKKLFVLTACSWVMGTLICSVRIFSCLAGVMSSNRMVENFHTIHDRSYMALRIFIPEIAGWMGPDAFNVLKSPNLNLIYSQLELPSSNPQNSFFVYFGVLPALLLVASFLTLAKGKQAFWKIYSLIVLAIALLWQPIWGILSILCLPLNHYSYHMIILPVGICALVGYAGIAWETGQWENTYLYRNLKVFLGLAGAYGCVFLTYLFPSLAFITRIIFLVVGLGIAVYYALRHRNILLGEKFLTLIGAFFQTLVLTLLILTTLFLILAPIPKKETLAMTLVLPFLWLTAIASMILNFYSDPQNSLDLKKFVGSKLVVLCMALLLSAFVVFFSVGNAVLSLELPVRVYALDLFVGILRLFLILQIGLLGFRCIAKKLLPVNLVFSIFLTLTAMDLIVFNARFNNITAPFYFKNAFYPKPFTYRDISPALRAGMDLVNYRVSHQDRQDFNANKNLVFGMPSYTGTVGYMTRRFSKLLTAFGYVDGIYMLYPEDATDNARFLDLSAVRYVFDENGNLVQRPRAFGRLNFFFSAETIRDDNKLLTRLKDSNFDAHKTLLLSDSTSLTSAELKEAFAVAIDHANPNRVESHLVASSSGYLLFADSYDEGWKAYLNGVQTPILRANYNFMACVIPFAGEYAIRFVYDPPEYKRNLFLSFWGVCLFFFVLFVGGIRKFFNKKK